MQIPFCSSVTMEYSSLFLALWLSLSARPPSQDSLCSLIRLGQHQTHYFNLIWFSDEYFKKCAAKEESLRRLSQGKTSSCIRRQRMDSDQTIQLSNLKQLLSNTTERLVDVCSVGLIFCPFHGVVGNQER